MTETAAAPAPAVAPAAPETASAPVAAPADTLLDTKAPEKPVANLADYALVAPKDSGFDDKRVGDVAAWAKANNVPPAVAQLILDRDGAAAKAEALAHAEQKTAWAEAIKAKFTPDALHDADVRVMSTARTVFGDAIATWLKDTGVGSHPDVFAGLLKLANAAKEGSIVKPGAPLPPKPRLFDNSPEMYGDPARKME